MVSDAYLIQLLTAAGIFIAFIVVSRLFVYVVDNYVRGLLKKTKTELDKKILDIVHRPIYLLINLFGLMVVLRYLGLPEGIIAVFEKLYRIAFILIGTWVSARIAELFIVEYLRRFAEQTRSELDETVVGAIEKFTYVVIYIMGALVALKELNIEITPLIASLGIGGLAVAFAAKDVIANLLSGIFILVDKPFKVGDRVVLESGEVCDVLEISLRSTRLLDIGENTLIALPNEKMAYSKIVNYSLPDARYKVKVEIGVAYGSDVKKVKETLLEIATRAPYVLKEPKPAVYFTGHGDFSLNFRLVAWIEDYRRAMEVKDFINTEIDGRFTELGIEIPFPVQTLHIKTEK